MASMMNGVRSRNSTEAAAITINVTLVTAEMASQASSSLCDVRRWTKTGMKVAETTPQHDVVDDVRNGVGQVVGVGQFRARPQGVGQGHDANDPGEAGQRRSHGHDGRGPTDVGSVPDLRGADGRWSGHREARTWASAPLLGRDPRAGEGSVAASPADSRGVGVGLGRSMISVSPSAASPSSARVARPGPPTPVVEVGRVGWREIGIRGVDPGRAGAVVAVTVRGTEVVGHGRPTGFWRCTPRRVRRLRHSVRPHQTRRTRPAATERAMAAAEVDMDRTVS